MSSIPTSLREWYDAKPPVICTVESLGREIPPNLYKQVYWISKQIDHLIVEACPLEEWFFTSDGHLVGEVDFAAWDQTVEIQPDEFIVLSMM